MHRPAGREYGMVAPCTTMSERINQRKTGINSPPFLSLPPPPALLTELPGESDGGPAWLHVLRPLRARAVADSPSACNRK